MNTLLFRPTSSAFATLSRIIKKCVRHRICTFSRLLAGIHTARAIGDARRINEILCEAQFLCHEIMNALIQFGISCCVTLFHSKFARVKMRSYTKRNILRKHYYYILSTVLRRAWCDSRGAIVMRLSAFGARGLVANQHIRQVPLSHAFYFVWLVWTIKQQSAFASFKFLSCTIRFALSRL